MFWMFWKRTVKNKALEKRNLLKIFNLSEETENLLIERMKECTLKKGDLVVREGAVGDSSMYLVASGTLIVLKRNSDGQEVEIAQMGEGDFFGEIALLRNEPRTSTVIAAEDCRLFEIEKKRSIDFLISNNPELKDELEYALLCRFANDRLRLKK